MPDLSVVRLQTKFEIVSYSNQESGREMKNNNLKSLQAKLLIWQESVDAVLGVVSSNIVSMAMLIGTMTIALTPAIFTGYAVYSLTVALWGHNLSLVTGIILR